MSDRFGTSPLWHPCHFESPLACRGRSCVLPSQVRHLLCHDDHKGSDPHERYLYWAFSLVIAQWLLSNLLGGDTRKSYNGEILAFCGSSAFRSWMFHPNLIQFFVFYLDRRVTKEIAAHQMVFWPSWFFCLALSRCYAIHFINLLCFHFLWQQMTAMPTMTAMTTMTWVWTPTTVWWSNRRSRFCPTAMLRCHNASSHFSTGWSNPPAIQDPAGKMCWIDVMSYELWVWSMRCFENIEI